MRLPSQNTVSGPGRSGACLAIADSFLDKAPTILWLMIVAPLVGAICHPGASGRAYTLQPGAISLGVHAIPIK